MNAYLISLVVLIAATLCLVRPADAVSCYSCNSADYMEGDKCRDLPDKNSFVVNCDVEGSELGRNYTMCRILVQDVEGDTRIVRSCATTGKPDRGCIDRTGTSKIKLRYCECLGDRCNAASRVTSFGIVMSLILLVVGHIRL